MPAHHNYSDLHQHYCSLQIQKALQIYAEPRTIAFIYSQPQQKLLHILLHLDQWTTTWIKKFSSIENPINLESVP